MRFTPIVSFLAIAVPLLQTVSAHAAPVAASGYNIGLFAAGPAGTSGANSVLVIGNDVYVGYGNGGNPDGSGGAVSTIVEFSRSGQVLASTSMTGHNDGSAMMRRQSRSGRFRTRMRTPIWSSSPQARSRSRSRSRLLR